MIRKFTVVRYTDRFDEMARFYRDTLGWTPTDGWDRGPDDRGLFVSPGPSMTHVEILHLGDVVDRDAGPPANVTLAVEVDDADQLLDQLVDRGVAIARGLETTPWGHRSFGVDDPDGLRIWFFHEVKE
jgi:uncharacterized glyoxalase superfamily protein PhnB